jgi:UDP-N-acetylglucosamine 2-epimerase (non-hydrolysing)
MAPLAHALAAAGVAPSVVITGQHPALTPAEFGLEPFGAQQLGCPGQTDPMAHVQAVRAAMLGTVKVRPDLLIVQGDTSSAFGAALAGFTAGVPVAHVEAGLRSHDPRLPWPEEVYRVAIDREAELLFAPTSSSAANLRAEGVCGRIHVTGNTGVDALLAIERRLPTRKLKARSQHHILVTCHRRESWRDGLDSIAAALIELASRGDCAIHFVLHPNPSVRARMEAALRSRQNINLLEPCDQLSLLCHLRDSDLALSDSGGIQEEAPSLGVPLLVLREKTERPEGIASGNCRLVGTSTDRIVKEVRGLLSNPAQLAAMSRRNFPYGDGRAAPRIAAIIKQWLPSGGLR